jgi:Tol biopolymer transport system component
VDAPSKTLSAPGEKHIRNIRQLTFGGQNAEAYFSADGKKLIFQSTRGDLGCDQIFTMNIDGTDTRRVSTGKGRTTCSYWFPDGSRIVYASTHLADENCPPPAPPPPPYVWRVYETFEIFSAKPDGSDLQRITESPGYDAEPTFAPDGSRIVFTSARSGDIEIWDMKPDGSDPRQLTKIPGYDGGPFYSPDGKRICFRASRPEGAALVKFRDLLSKGMVEPSKLEIYVMDADGKNVRQITRNGRANFCPFFHPSGKQIIYASNKDSTNRRKPNFELYLVDLESGKDERITFDEDFDGFPMFSPDGSKLVWASNRNGKVRGETNVFIADWVR